LLKARKIDVDYLARYSNAAWLVIVREGEPSTGCSRATIWASRW
jgi:hypothetical protein